MSLFLLTGCSRTPKEMERALQFRTSLLSHSGCSFTLNITADYGDKVHKFALDCTADADGTVRITVVQPKSIAGITAVIDSQSGRLTFGETALTFPPLADGQVMPIRAPWILMNTLRSGYIAAAGMEGNLLRLSIDDSYADNALRLEIWLDESNCPVHAAIVYRNRSILSMDTENFRME